MEIETLRMQSSQRKIGREDFINGTALFPGECCLISGEKAVLSQSLLRARGVLRVSDSFFVSFACFVDLKILPRKENLGRLQCREIRGEKRQGTSIHCFFRPGLNPAPLKEIEK